MSSLRNNILNAILTDDSYTPKQDRDIIRIYINSSSTEKVVLNNLFISLCGFSLETFIDQSISNEKSFDNSTTDLNQPQI